MFALLEIARIYKALKRFAEIRGRGPGLKKMFFSALWPSVSSKNKGGGRGPSLGSATTIGFYV